MNMSISKKGFTLIELLLVIAIISILLVVVFAALNPATRLQETRNANRWNAINNLLTAVHECVVDNDGSLTTCGLGNPQVLSQIGTCASGGADNCAGATAACLDLDGVTELDTYISSMPIDPTSAGTAAETGYSISVSNGIVSINSCLAEGGETISVSR
jgi:prepilin-type N-terminal cleavage/methylation domain-containing protein